MQEHTTDTNQSASEWNLERKGSQCGKPPELWDLLDGDGHLLGKTHIRGEALPPGTYHRVVEIFTVNSRGELLLTLRSPDKYPFPDMWEVTGGSVLAGEDSLTAARRELREETGLSVEDGEIEWIHTRRGKTVLMDVYLARKDAAISDLTMQEGETAAAQWVTFDTFERMIASGEVPDPVCGRYADVKEIIKTKIG